jgi:type II secretion system protein H
MNRAHPRRGSFADGSKLKKGGMFLVSGSGFTLLEMIMVLVIIAILAGLALPSIQTAFTEQSVRKDAHQLALMIKTAMIQSAEQHRAYILDLTDKTMALHPANEAAKDPDAPSSPAATADATDDALASPVVEDVEVSITLDPANKLLTPDLQKANAWVDMPPTSWLFQPGELCQVTRVRLERGNAWLEMSFSALTGNVENETTYFP